MSHLVDTGATILRADAVGGAFLLILRPLRSDTGAIDVLVTIGSNKQIHRVLIAEIDEKVILGIMVVK